MQNGIQSEHTRSSEQMGSTITPVLVGRNHEYHVLENALADALAASGRCVLLSGEAGIGKSRLLAEIQTQARHSGFTVLVGRCFEQDMTIPYAPLIDMLRTSFYDFSKSTITESLEFFGAEAPEVARLLPEFAAHIPTSQPLVPLNLEADQRRLFDALVTILLRHATLRKTTAQPVALILEDIHWADVTSLSFLLFLARRIVSAPFILLLSYRPSESNEALVSLLTALDREPLAQTLRLKPLTFDEVEQMLATILGQQQEISSELVAAIHTLTDGNPFFTEEVFTALIAAGDIYFVKGGWRRKPLAQMAIPDSVQRSVRQRLDRVSPQAAQLLNLAAISGRSFDFRVLQTLTGHRDDEMLALIKELIRNHLVVEEGVDHFAFRHALTREALYARLLARERQLLHAQMAEAIEQIHTDTIETYPEALAYHFFEGGKWAKALEYARRAGVKAEALYAPYATITQVTRALTASAHLSPPPPLIDLYRLRGKAHDSLGEFDEALRDFEAALGAARAPRAEWQALLDLGLLWASRDIGKSGDYCRRALDLAHEMKDEITIGHSLNRLGNWMMNRGQPAEALDYHQQALARFVAIGDKPGIATSLDLLAMTSNQSGDIVGTVEYYTRAIPILRELNDLQTLCSSLTNLSVYTLDEMSIYEAVELARQIEWRAGEAYALQYQGFILNLLGKYDQALAAAHLGLTLAQAIDHRLWMAWGHIILGQIYLELFALEEAYQHLNEGRAIALASNSSFMSVFATATLASVCIMQNRLDEAAILLAEQPGAPMIVDYMIGKAAMEMAFARGEPQRALDIFAGLALPGREHWFGVMAFFLRAFHMAETEALIMLNRLHDREATLRDVLQLCENQGIRTSVWRIYLLLGKIHLAGRQVEQAESAFTTARALVEEAAAQIADDTLRHNFLQQALALIPPTRVRASEPARRHEFGGLTRREREVAAEIAAGRSNQEIADELVVSVKTIEAHVTRTLSKLGFHSRAQIAAWAVDKGLASAPQDMDTRANMASPD